MIIVVAPYFGYFASLCLIVALLVKTDVRFRIFNILGCSAFILYALIFKAWPVLITNSILFAINIFYLRKIYSRKEDFDLLEITPAEKMAHKFISFNMEDIGSYFPKFNVSELERNLNFIVTRDLVIANIFSAHLHSNGDAVVSLNYTAKKFRDFKIGKFIFDKEKQVLASKGVRRIVYTNVFNKSHEVFLKISGFTGSGGQYFKDID